MGIVRVITSKELARLAGVSQSTVSRALNDSPLISIEKKVEIQQLAKKLRFEMNSQAKSLRTRRTDTIGIMFPHFFMNLSTNLYFTHLFDSLQGELSKYDYDLLIIYDSKDQSQLSPLEKMIKRKKVDGFVLVRPNLSKEEKEMLDNSNLPYVSVFCQDYEDEGVSKYSINTYDGGVLAGTYFAQYKEFSPLYFGLHDDDVDSSNRFSGFTDGLSVDGRNASSVEKLASDMSIPGAYQAVIKHLSYFKTKRSVFVFNDMMACGLLLALKDQQIRVPEQVQLISNDDIPLAQWMTPQLSTLHFPNEKLIETACKRLVREIVTGRLENENVQLSPELKLRGTTNTTFGYAGGSI
ncbi:substrate-binding domain-containing protein [Treponema sp.]